MVQILFVYSLQFTAYNKDMFKDRSEAGKKLAEKIAAEVSLGQNEGIIVAVPRGGIIVGKELAQKLNLPLEVLVTKKLPAPGSPELAIGAVGEGQMVYFNEEICQSLCLTENYKNTVLAEKRKELALKKVFFRGEKPDLDLKDKVVILTDDGVATGATMLASLRVIKTHRPKKIIVAIPVLALDILDLLQKEADQVIYLEAPEMFLAVGQFYQNFSQVSDEEVLRILNSK